MSANLVPQYGWTTPKVPASQVYLYDLLETMLEGYAPGSLLDLGCGNGYLAGRLAGRGFDVVGVEADADGYQIASRAYPSVKFIQADATRLAHSELGQMFDVIVSSEVIEHLFDPAAFVRTMRMFIKPGGTLILTTPYHGYLKNLFITLAGRWDHHHNPLYCGGHIKFWSPKTLSRLLTKNGFRMTSWQGAGRFPYLWKSMIIVAEPTGSPCSEQ